MNGNDIDDLLKLSSLQEVEIPEKIDQRIEETLKKCKKRKPNFVFYFGRIIATIATGLTIAAGGIVVYAGATGRLSFDIGNTGHKKIDKNYNEVATSVDQKIDNEYFTLTLESMAADPAYLIFEYDIKLKDKAMQEIGEIYYEKPDGYGIELNSNTYINGQEKILVGGRNLWSIEKIADQEFRLVEIYSISNIPENTLNVNKKLNNLIIYENEERKIGINVEISQIMTAEVLFENREPKVLAQTELSNGATLYIEEVSNSKFENYVLARTVSQTKKYKDFWSKESQFMFEDYVDFAICDQNGNTINHDFDRLDEFYEKLQEDGTYLAQPAVEAENYFEIGEEDLVRMQQVQLLKLAIEDGNEPEQIQILPICRKLYNDRNSSEADFYQQEDWYQVKLGENNISETSQIGGNVTITNIEENEEEIIFTYEKEGFVPSYIDLVVRVKDSQMNYYYPRFEEIAGIDGEGNKIVYSKMTFGLSGMPLLGKDRLDNLDELEFALFYHVKNDILADSFVFDWDKNENDEVATIKNIEFTDFVEDINDELASLHGNVYYKGIVTEVNNQALKFYSDNNKKEFTLSNPNQFQYVNGRTNETLDFEKIKPGDLFQYTWWGGNYETGQFVIIRNLSGNELKDELIRQLANNAPIFHVDFVYREATNIQVIDDNTAIITYDISDMYQDVIGNDEKFKIQVLVNTDTEIYRDDAWAGQHFQIRDLETVEYVPERVTIYLDKSTINDEIPTAREVDIGWLDEDF